MPEQVLADIVIPVHLGERPVRRAAASVVDGDERARAIVVAHNIDPDVIRQSLAEYAEHPRVRLLALADGIPSPAGPLNHGVEHAEAEYYGVLGSDDELEPGAVTSWLAMARRDRADVVMARVRRSIGGVEPTPPTRPGRTAGLDAVTDRLTYRCVPQGLISRERFGHLRFTPGLRSGEDQEFTAQLWFTAERISYDRTGPAYVLNEDGADRVTSTRRSVDEDFAFIEPIARATWFRALDRRARRAWGVKMLRVHVMDAIAARLETGEEFPAHAGRIIAVLQRVEALAPGSTALLCRADRDVLDEVGTVAPDPDRIRGLLARRWGWNPGSLLTRNPLLSLHRQSHYRTMRDMRA